MRTINLIPAARRAAKRRRFHVRCCIAACIAFLFAASGLSAAWRATAAESDSGVNDQLAAVASEIDHNTKAVATSGAQIDALRTQLAANRQVLSQPDWSLLLALLGKELGDQIVLNGCALKLDDAPAAAGASTASPRPGGLVLHLSGFGKSNQAVTDFVLRLESTQLFSRVSLVDTSHNTYLGGDAYAFRIDCPLDTAK
jgi:Tfp pilus assembly protein PilN